MHTCNKLILITGVYHQVRPTLVLDSWLLCLQTFFLDITQKSFTTGRRSIIFYNYFYQTVQLVV